MSTRQAIAEAAGPLTLTIFGITGDLSSRMLLPALYDLALQDLLPKPLRIIGITRREHSVENLLESIKKAVTQKGETCDKQVLTQLGQQISLITMDLANAHDYDALRQHLDQLEEAAGVCMNRLFYLAIPAQLFDDVVAHMGKSGLQHNCPHGSGESRLLVEKPFGHDLASAQKLVDNLRQHFAERQVFRIDHFLAKETAQNILTFRMHNPLFNAVWNREHIRHVLISVTEELDIEGRANFYEQTGALRDMMQSHVLQLLTLATMDMPDTLSTQAVHNKRQALLDAIQPINPSHAVRAQYSGYRDEVNNPDSHVETYAALQLSINNGRWQDVPMLLRTGKALREKMTEITLTFGRDNQPQSTNTLTIQLSPNEGISLLLHAKKPGFDHTMQQVTMDFCYHRSFAGERQPTAYERVLIDAFRGDQTLFATSKEVLASWRILKPLLAAWAKDDQGLHTYQKQSDGPKAAEQLAESVHAAWPTEAIKSCAVHIA